MLYNMEWLKEGEMFPPLAEIPRITRYLQNILLFDSEHFSEQSYSYGVAPAIERPYTSVYQKCSERITRVIGNFDEVISFPVLLNYQRMMSLKMADLVCGEYPSITTSSQTGSALDIAREYTEFDQKLYSTVLDLSRFGDSVWRVYIDSDGQRNFTTWNPAEWYPVVSQDGTLTILKHCICWRENRGPSQLNPDWYLCVQIHGTRSEDIGWYEYREYHMAATYSSIGKLVVSERVPTGLDKCAVTSMASFKTSTSVYGYDDYTPIDSVLAEIMTRVGQISVILDKHSDPSMTGPTSMLRVDPETGSYRIEHGKFYAVSAGEEQPKYLTWDGQLSSAFKELEELLNQLYILSEMGAALLGGKDGSSQAISGAAMRFKMVNPLAKARRVANSLTRPIKKLFETLTGGSVDSMAIGIEWADGLPDDPSENIANAKLATGESKLMPLNRAIVEFFGRSTEEADQWIEQIKAETSATYEDPNKPGPQDGTGVNPTKKQSTTGLTNFHGTNNQ